MFPWLRNSPVLLVWNIPFDQIAHSIKLYACARWFLRIVANISLKQACHIFQEIGRRSGSERLALREFKTAQSKNIAAQ